ncbi:hypothetical protein ACU4GA_17745 [Methylobacterium oryzae CBMB20]
MQKASAPRPLLQGSVTVLAASRCDRGVDRVAAGLEHLDAGLQAASACEVATQPAAPNIGIRSDGYYLVTQSNGFMAQFPASAAHALPRPSAYRTSAAGEGAAGQGPNEKRGPEDPRFANVMRWLETAQ